MSRLKSGSIPVSGVGRLVMISDGRTGLFLEEAADHLPYCPGFKYGADGSWKTGGALSNTGGRLGSISIVSGS